jgi:hypothetical protein
MNKRLLVLAAACTLAAASPAAATVIISVGPGAIQPDENLLFKNGPTPGTTIEGITNQTDTLVTIEGGEPLLAKGGQARLDTTDDKISTTFTFNGLTNQLVGFDLADAGLAFTSTEFRLFGGKATEATLTFVDTTGEVFTQTFTIPANGFFSAVATDGELIDYFSIAANNTIGDIRQVRLGGVQLIPTVPEPATWAMMIAGFGGVGGMARQRRRLVKAPA